ncbi:MAG: phospholipase D family protein [Opitutaceae bacterium]|nr:phospholipase D family protein [Opitutaceae bacterium]
MCLVFSALPLLLAAGCSSVRSNYSKPPSQALAPPAGSPAAPHIREKTAAHPAGESGFRLLALSADALAARVTLADAATRSIDVQYFIFHDDATGNLVASRLLAAAGRGVRVRVLIDGTGSIGRDKDLLALDAHPNLEVRIFNPFKNRSSNSVSLATQFLLDGRRLNRRMHNKSFIVDNQIAIIGGRNIGDEYFDARQDMNYRDLDVVTIGPVVASVSQSFDTFWNSDYAYPITAFHSRAPAPADVERRRAKIAAGALAPAPVALIETILGDEPIAPRRPRRAAAQSLWHWGPAQLIADDPLKANPDSPKKGPRLGEILDETLPATKDELIIISPYFVPRKQGVALLAGIAQRGASVKVLTNSLASTDTIIVHTGYARYRRGLLAAGVELYELRPIPARKTKFVFRGKRSRGISLHAKAIVIDRRMTFIGSMNLDSRSALLNTEIGVLVESPALAAAVAQFFNEASEPDSSFQPRLLPPNSQGLRLLCWLGELDGEEVKTYVEPRASLWRRLRAKLLRILPVEGLL